MLPKFLLSKRDRQLRRYAVFRRQMQDALNMNHDSVNRYLNGVLRTAALNLLPHDLLARLRNDAQGVKERRYQILRRTQNPPQIQTTYVAPWNAKQEQVHAMYHGALRNFADNQRKLQQRQTDEANMFARADFLRRGLSWR